MQTFTKVDKFCTASYAEFHTNQEVTVKSMDGALLVLLFTVMTYYADFHENQNFSLNFWWTFPAQNISQSNNKYTNYGKIFSFTSLSKA